jgi:hypothetical protein
VKPATTPSRRLMRQHRHKVVTPESSLSWSGCGIALTA